MENAKPESQPSSPLVALLPEDLHKSDVLSSIPDVSTLATKYIESQSMLSKQALIPTPESSPEEWSKVYDALGRPFDKHYVPLDSRSKDDEAIISDYESLFYDSGLSLKQGEAIIQKMYDLQDAQMKQYKESIEAAKNANLDILTKKYGSKIDEIASTANLAINKYGSKELSDLVQESGYNPVIFEFLVNVGNTLKSDSLVTGNTTETYAPDSAKREITRLESDNDFMVKYSDKNHIGHETAVKTLQGLYEPINKDFYI